MIYETKPRDYQVKAYDLAMDWMKDHPYYALFMDMGTGKTKVSIDIMSNLFKEGKIEAVLLIAPNGVQEQWYTQEILKHTPVITSELLWKNSKALYWQDKLSDFVGPKRESIEVKLKKNTEKSEEVLGQKEQEEKEKIMAEERAKINALFGDTDPLDEETKEYIYSKPVEPEVVRESKWENQKDCLKWLCVNVERFSSGDGRTFQPFIDFMKNHKCAMIIDESTSIKNPNANRSKVITKLGKIAVYKLILTGTPVTNSPFDVYSMLDFCRPGFWQCNYYTFKNRYGILIKDTDTKAEHTRTFTRSLRPHEFEMVRNKLKQGMEIDEVSLLMGLSESNVKWIKEHPETTRPYKRLNEIKEAIEPCSFIIKKDDCLDIPPKIFDTVLLDMTKEQGRVYKDLKTKLLAMYEDKELTVQNKAALSIRLQQIAGGHFPFKDEDNNACIKQIGGSNPKINYLKQDIAEAGYQKIIIWAKYVPEIELIMRDLKKEFPYSRIEGYYGGTKTGERNQIKNEFQEGKVDILVANPQVGSMGLNLQASTLHYFYSNSYSLMFRLQAEDRSHRFGQDKNVQYKDLVMKGTIDEKVLISLRQNKEVLDYFKTASLKDII